MIVAPARWLLGVAALTTLALPSPARAGVILTFEAPGVQSSQVPGITTETFNSIPAGVYNSGLTTAVGSLSGRVAIVRANVFGGAGGTGNYLAIGSQSGSTTATLTLNGPQAYFGFWWSAADPYNAIDFYTGPTLVASFKPDTTLAGLSPAYNSNPNPGFNWSQPFVYVNVFATGVSTFDRIVIQNTNIALAGTELDNFSVRATAATPTGTFVPGGVTDFSPAPVPEPATALLFAAGAAAVGLYHGCRRAGLRWLAREAA